jgi:hypothetical protein
MMPFLFFAMGSVATFALAVGLDEIIKELRNIAAAIRSEKEKQ